MQWLTLWRNVNCWGKPPPPQQKHVIKQETMNSLNFDDAWLVPGRHVSWHSPRNSSIRSWLCRVHSIPLYYWCWHCVTSALQKSTWADLTHAYVPHSYDVITLFLLPKKLNKSMTFTAFDFGVFHKVLLLSINHKGKLFSWNEQTGYWLTNKVNKREWSPFFMLD